MRSWARKGCYRLYFPVIISGFEKIHESDALGQTTCAFVDFGGRNCGVQEILHVKLRRICEDHVRVGAGE